LLLKRRAVCSALAGTPADLVTVTMLPRATRLNSHVRTRDRLPLLLGGGFGMRGPQSSRTDGSAYQQDHIPTPHLSASTCLSVLEMMSVGLPGKYVRELFDFGRAPDDDSHDGTRSGSLPPQPRGAPETDCCRFRLPAKSLSTSRHCWPRSRQGYDIASGWRKYRVDDPQAPNRPTRTGMKRSSSPCRLMFVKIAARYALNQILHPPHVLLRRAGVLGTMLGGLTLGAYPSTG
jgi:hypothetical protein